MVIPAPLYVLLGPLLISLAGILGERMKFDKFRELIAIIMSAVNVGAVYLLYNMVQATPDKILVVNLVAMPPIAACLEIDMLGIFMAFSAASLGLFATVYSYNYMEHDTRLTEFYALLSALVVSMMGVAFAGDFFTLFVAWEMMGISSYVLVAFRKETSGPIEAGFKYMVMGSIGSTVLFLGIALLYGMTGTVNFAQISSVIHGQPISIWLYLVFAVMIVGFGIKSAIVPMHTWLPDAHPEAPSPISAMLSGMLIETALYGLSRIMFILYEPEVFKLPIATLALITMCFANIMALTQKDIKRMLAYSSIAQMGYMLVGLSAGTAYGMQGVFLHVFNHSLMKGLAFLGAGSLAHVTETRNIDEMKGVGNRMPLTTLSLFIALLGLGGVPGTNGFMSKFVLFGSAIGVGMWWLAVAGVLNSAFSMAYYLRTMYVLISEPVDRVKNLKEAPLLMVAVSVVMAVLIVITGIFPQMTSHYAKQAAEALVTSLGSYVGAVV